jgi:hypothetical protein
MGIDQAIHDAWQTHTNKQFIADLDALTGKLRAPGKGKGVKKIAGTMVNFTLCLLFRPFNLPPFLFLNQRG